MFFIIYRGIEGKGLYIEKRNSKTEKFENDMGG